MQVLCMFITFHLKIYPKKDEVVAILCNIMCQPACNVCACNCQKNIWFVY